MWYKSHDSLQLWVIMAEMQSQPSFFMALLRIAFPRTKLMGRQPFILQSSLNYSLVWLFCLTVFRESVTGWLNLKTEFCPHVCWCNVLFSNQYSSDFLYAHIVFWSIISLKGKSTRFKVVFDNIDFKNILFQVKEWIWFYMGKNVKKFKLRK